DRKRTGTPTHGERVILPALTPAPQMTSTLANGACRYRRATRGRGIREYRGGAPAANLPFRTGQPAGSRRSGERDARMPDEGMPLVAAVPRGVQRTDLAAADRHQPDPRRGPQPAPAVLEKGPWVGGRCERSRQLDTGPRTVARGARRRQGTGGGHLESHGDLI